MTIDDYINTVQRKSIAQCYKNSTIHLVSVLNKEDLEKPERHTTKLSLLGRFSDKNVFVRECDGEPELWVRTDYKNYRKAFEKFLSVYYSVENIPSDYHVDHSLARCIAKKNGLQYIRLFLVPAVSNLRHGSLVERKMKSLIKDRKGYRCSMYMYIKLLGVRFPESIEELRNNFYNIVDAFIKKVSTTREDAMGSLLGMFKLWKDVYYDNQMSNKIQVDLAMKCFIRKITLENVEYQSIQHYRY